LAEHKLSPARKTGAQEKGPSPGEMRKKAQQRTQGKAKAAPKRAQDERRRALLLLFLGEDELDPSCKEAGGGVEEKVALGGDLLASRARIASAGVRAVRAAGRGTGAGRPHAGRAGARNGRSTLGESVGILLFLLFLLFFLIIVLLFLALESVVLRSLRLRLHDGRSLRQRASRFAKALPGEPKVANDPGGSPEPLELAGSGGAALVSAQEGLGNGPNIVGAAIELAKGAHIKGIWELEKTYRGRQWCPEVHK